MRLEMIQNSMSLLPTAARVRRATVPRARRKRASGDGERERPGDAEGDDGDDDGEEQEQEDRDGGELHLEADAHQRVGGERADEDGEERAAEGDHHRVHVGAEGVVLEEHEPPGVEVRPEVDEGDVEGAVVDLAGAFERGDEDPVERDQHHEGPEREEDVGDDAGDGRLLLDRGRLEEAGEEGAVVPRIGLWGHASNLRVWRTTKLKKETQTTVETKSSM